MCGIVGYIGKDEKKEIIINGLKELEYRGYDSAGMAVMSDKGKDIKYFKNALYLGFNHAKNPLKGEIAAYYIKYNNINIFVMGSMNWDKNITYPKNIDYLILAFQGRSDLNEKVKDILNILKPKHIILSHFDNSFPPISKDVDIRYIRNLKGVIVPEYEKIIEIKK